MAIKERTQKDFIKTALRVPPDLHSALHKAAAEAERGFNAEILFRLRQSFKGARTPPAPTP
ncbi:Arc family DNA-binding protein [Pseudorhodoferax sp. LjRoot39]|uniref:Arc family DNA-binding protein n=1 Tax=Pseudorhodoferax sp. LjRoot39 TaxID=3342328 RepID=UPI003ECE6DF1